MLTYSWYIYTNNERLDFIDLQSAKAYVDMNGINRSSLAFSTTSDIPVTFNLSNPVTTDNGCDAKSAQSGDF